MREGAGRHGTGWAQLGWLFALLAVCVADTGGNSFGKKEAMKPSLYGQQAWLHLHPTSLLLPNFTDPGLGPQLPLTTVYIGWAKRVLVGGKQCYYAEVEERPEGPFLTVCYEEMSGPAFFKEHQDSPMRFHMTYFSPDHATGTLPQKGVRVFRSAYTQRGVTFVPDRSSDYWLTFTSSSFLWGGQLVKTAVGVPN